MPVRVSVFRQGRVDGSIPGLVDGSIPGLVDGSVSSGRPDAPVVYVAPASVE